ncbi:MAG: response regulator [Patescibacteria group bacterium]
MTVPTDKITILLVEDDKFLRDLISGKLKQEGYTVVEGVDGDEGLRLLKEKQPSIVLLDLVIPGIDGFELLKTAKGDTSVSAIPIIVLSNLGAKEDIDKAMALGAHDFLVKAHYTPAEIVQTVKDIIQKAYN